MIDKICSVILGVGQSFLLWFDSRDNTARQFGVFVVGIIVIGFVVLRLNGIRG